jgi:hypothetical protein
MDAVVEVPAAENVRLVKFEQLTGYTEKAVRRKIEAGVWLEGYEVDRAANGDITVYMPGYYRWARGLPRIERSV